MTSSRNGTGYGQTATGLAGEERGRVLGVLRDLPSGLSVCSGVRDCLGSLLEFGLRLPGFDCGFACLPAIDDGGMEIVASRGLGNAFAARLGALGSALLSAGASGGVRWFWGADLGPEMAVAMEVEGVAGWVNVFLSDGEGSVGLLGFSKHAGGAPSAAEIASLKELWGLARHSIAAAFTRQRRRVVEREARLVVGHSAGEMAPDGGQGTRLMAIKLALEAAGTGVWHLEFPSGRVELDPVCLAMFGYGSDARPSLDDLVARIHPDCKGGVENSLDAVRRPGGSDVWDCEFRVVPPDGVIRWLLGRGRVYRDGEGEAVRMVGINIDITDRKESERLERQWGEQLERLVDERSRELLESENRFRCLVDATEDGVVMSEAGFVIDTNPQAAAMFGYEPDEVTGHSSLEFVAPESLETVRTMLQGRGTERFEWTGLRKDGSRFPVESQARLIERHGRCIRVGTLHDLTETRRVAELIAAQRADLDRTRELALISEIGAGIVHQISQPLSAVATNLAALKLWRQGCHEVGCAVRAMLGKVEAEITAMRDGVSRLRSLSVPRGLDLAVARVERVVRDVLPLLRLEADARRLGLEADLAPGLPEIEADSAHLGQVLISLARNAMEACRVSPGAGGTVRIATREAAGGKVEILVTDTGGGMPDEVRERLFAPFVTTRPGATGIGLRLCQTIIHAHQGVIEGANTPDGAGACFRILLPANNPAKHTKV